MRFLLASHHPADARRLDAAGRGSSGAAPAMVEVRCPRCDARYVAYLAGGEEPWGQDRAWAVTWRLFRVCPDHPPTFAVT